jgi:hypothetical protein
MRKLVLLAALLNACDDAVVAPRDATLDSPESDAVTVFDASQEPLNAPADVLDAGIDAR